MEYKYGMRLRGYSIGCQPDTHLMKVEEDTTGRYHNILTYSEPLTIKQVNDYELDDLNKIDKIQDALYMNDTYQRLDGDAEKLKEKYEELFDQCEKEYEEYEVGEDGATNEDLEKLEEIELKYAFKIYNEMKKEVV